VGRGFLSGIFWGAVVGVALLFVSSQALDRQQMSLPQPEASPVEVPGGSEFDQARAESDPVLPEPESAPGAEPASGIALPEDGADAPPAMDTSALEVPVPTTTEEAPGLGVVPEPETGAPAAPAAESAVTSAPSGPLVEPEAPATAPEAAVEPEAPAAAPEAEPAPEAVASEADGPDAGTEVAVLPATEADASAPEPAPAPEVSLGQDAPAAPAAPEVSEEIALPEAADAPDQPDLPQIAAPAPEAESAPVVPEPEVAELPAPAPAPAPEPAETPEVAAAEPEPEAPEVAAAEPESEAPGAASIRVDGGPSLLKPVEGLTEDSTVETGRLPQAGGEGDLPGVLRIGSDDEAAAPEASTEEAATDEAAEPAEGPALQVYGTPFENPEGRPLLSIVLVHVGDGPPDPAQLASLPANVSFAVDAGGANAPDIARAYRAAGREVVMIPSLPASATPQDIEQALQANFDRVPEAVALMDLTGSSFQSDRNAVSQVVAVAGATGHGLITFPRGLNTAHQEAQRSGVPAGLIFRDIDGAGEDQEQIGRALDRAAFRARQDEAVILVGTTAVQTLAAVIEWSLGTRAQSVTIAPVSAALLGG
jgi:polysaccharide deacetylase 2 family uncharacterized protein YibQ